jgi:hypothetical protein
MCIGFSIDESAKFAVATQWRGNFTPQSLILLSLKFILIVYLKEYFLVNQMSEKTPKKYSRFRQQSAENAG